MITVNVWAAHTRLTQAFEQLSKKKVDIAIAQAINQTLLLGRTEARKAVKRVYNIPQKNLNGVGIHKAISSAGKYHLRGDIYASSVPIPMDAFAPRFQFVAASGSASKLSISKKGVLKTKELKRTGEVAGVSIEVKKGQRVVIPYAFLIPGAQPRVFGRGQYKSGSGSYGFIQRHTREENTSGNDSVKPLLSVTVFGAVINPLVKQAIATNVQSGFDANMLKALRRQASMM